MRFQIRYLFCLMTIVAQGWSDGDLDQQNIGSENIRQPAQQATQTRFQFASHIDLMGSAKIDKGFFKGDKIEYAEAKIEAGMALYYSPSYTEGVNIAVGFEPTFLRWEQNPWFKQEHFNLLSISITGFTQRMNRWFWRSQLTANFDTEEWSGQYTSYDILLWGRYTYRENVGIHFGFLAETGLHMDRVYPIIGFDWQISRDWALNIIYPVNVSLNYRFTPVWTLSLAGRFFNSRFRVKKEEAFAKSLLRYTNLGAEFAVKYAFENTSANIHAGTTFAGKYRVANSKNHHAHNYYLTSNLYVGAEIDIKF